MCISDCYVKEASLPDSLALSCAANGTWDWSSSDGSKSCTTIRVDPNSQRGYLFVPQLVTWPMAVELARSYFFGRAVGQLAILSSANENSLAISAIEASGSSSPAWLGAARDELNISAGIFWQSVPSYKTQLFVGSDASNGSVVPNMYSNFAPSAPDLLSGALALDSFTGLWFVRTFVRMFGFFPTFKVDLLFFDICRKMRAKNNLNGFLVMILIDQVYFEISLPPLEACGPFSFCNCAETTVMCTTRMLSIPLIPNRTTTLSILDRNFSFIPAQALKPSLQTLVFSKMLLTRIPTVNTSLMSLVDLSFKVCARSLHFWLAVLSAEIFFIFDFI